MESERGYDESLWQLLCEQVGVAALVVPEEFGGAGGELADAAVVLEELGRALVPTPLLGTTLAELALLSADEPDADTLEQLAAGASIGTVVFDPDYVVNGDVADVVIARRRRARLTRWTEFTADARRHHGPDPPAGAASAATQTAAIGADPGLADTAAHPAGRRAGRRGDPLPGPDRRVHQGPGAVRPADRQLPGAQAPDGRPVRRGADRRRRRRRGRRRTRRRPRPRWPDVAASEAFRDVAAEAVQMHGGIAITWEHDIQLYFKRAHGSAAAARAAERAPAPPRGRGVRQR